MECRPFNIKVMLVAPGAIKSNIAANQSYDPRPDTVYTKYMERILARRDISQHSPTPTDVFARRGGNECSGAKSTKLLDAGSTFDLFLDSYLVSPSMDLVFILEVVW
jgi:1-acylglycerone phosphate reductase